MSTTTTTSNNIEHRPDQIAFERARDAAIIIRTVRPMLSESQVETLALILDHEAIETIEQSVEEAKREHKTVSTKPCQVRFSYRNSLGLIERL